MAEVTLVGDVVIPPDGVVFNCHFPGRVLGNLEAPVCSEKKSKRPKAGPHLTSCVLPSAFQGGIVSLANNHAMDYGDEGLQSTISACRSLDISTVGAGQTLEEARKALIFRIGNVRLGVLTRCEAQFGAATLWRPGVAVLDPRIYGEISRLKSEVDIVIISVHGAAEMSPWPSPQWQSLLRSFIDAGATVVHGHHAHVPQGYEEYNHGLIFYSLGNFIVDPKRWQSIPGALWSVISDIKFSQKGIEQYHVRTVTIKSTEKVEITESTQDESLFHKQYLEKACSCLSSEKLLLGLWQEISMKLYYEGYAQWLGFRSKSFLHGLNGHLQKIFNPKYNDLRRYHLFACDSHRDAIATALGLLSGELDDLRTSETEALVKQMAPWLIKN
jgi:poly-gamma-glutamate synthesis protein (capsule biosynthesis protein)